MSFEDDITWRECVDAEQGAGGDGILGFGSFIIHRFFEVADCRASAWSFGCTGYSPTHERGQPGLSRPRSHMIHCPQVMARAHASHHLRGSAGAAEPGAGANDACCVSVGGVGFVGVMAQLSRSASVSRRW